MKQGKKLLIIAITLAMALAIAACGKAPDSGVNWDESFGIIARKEGNDKVTVILSPARSDGVTQKDLDDEKEKYGYYSAVINSDGSVTRVVTEDYYERMVAATRELTDYYAQALVQSGQYPNVVHAAYTQDFKASVLFTKSEHPDQTEITAMLSLMEQAKNYLAINGEDPNQETQSYIVNAETGEYLYGMTDKKGDEIDGIIQSYLSGSKNDAPARN